MTRADIARDEFLGTLDTAARAMVRKVVTDESSTRFVQDNEIELINEGIVNGLLHVDGNVVYLKGSDVRAYDLFTLNREYLTQFAAYTALVTKYGYPIAQCRFEYHFMDVCAFLEEKPFVYVETKIAERPTDLLLEKILAYAPKVARLLEEVDRGNDPLRKAKYIFNDKPAYLWLVTPKRRQAFRIAYTAEGFSLEAVPDIPSFTEAANDSGGA